MNQRDARVGDRVKVEGGPYDGRVGRIGLVRSSTDILFEQGKQPITGLLTEDMALVKFEQDPGDGSGEIGVPIRRLKVL
jgi:hypothetical protein